MTTPARRGGWLLALATLIGGAACADVLGIDRAEVSDTNTPAPEPVVHPLDGGDSLTCSADVTADGNHCGACGHACGGAACERGMCQPHDFLAGRRARGLAAVGDALYWFEPGEGIRWCIDSACSSGARFTPLNDTSSATSFVGGTPLRWTTATGTLSALRCFDPNCPPLSQLTGYRKATLTGAREGDALVAASERLEAEGGANDTAVLLCTDTSCRTLSTARDVIGARFTVGGVLLVDRAGGVLACNGDDCSHPVRILDGANSERFEHASHDRLLWRQVREDGTGAFYACTLPACSVRQVVTTFTRSIDVSAQLDKREVFVFDNATQDLRRCDVDDCRTPALVLHGEYAAPFAIADHFVYWTGAGGTTIRRVAR